MATKDDLQTAFAGESRANRMYTAFAKKAGEQGLAQVAKLFRAAAEAETVHALAHFRAMGGIKDTAENLKTAVEGEKEEFKKMYPEFLARAREEDNKPAELSFKYALAVEKIHHGLYSKALEAVQSGNDLEETAIYVCTVCGNTVEGAAPEKCPVCGVPRKKFIHVS